MSRLEIHLFGVGKVLHHGTAGVHELPPSVRSLLGYLVLNRHRPHHRDLLAHAFWADVDERSARNRLSTTLWRLRKVLEPDGVEAGSFLVASRNGEVRFNEHSDYWLDVAAFEQAATSLLDLGHAADEVAVRRFERVADVFGNELLEGADQPWLVLERERLVQLYLSATARCMEFHAVTGALESALAAGRRILDRDPLREDVHRSLIRLYAKAGRRSSASRQFERCRQLLDDELGVSPLPETLAAAAAVERELVAQHDPDQLEQAIVVVERASRSLGAVLGELEEMAQALRASLPSS